MIHYYKEIIYKRPYKEINHHLINTISLNSQQSQTNHHFPALQACPSIVNNKKSTKTTVPYQQYKNGAGPKTSGPRV